jgi:hypothetical protein
VESRILRVVGAALVRLRKFPYTVYVDEDAVIYDFGNLLSKNLGFGIPPFVFCPVRHRTKNSRLKEALCH